MLLLSKLKISGFICDIVIRFVKQIVKNSFFADYEDHQHSYHHETNTHSTLKHVFMCTCRCIYIFIHTSFCLLGFSSITYHHGCFLPLHHRYLFTLVSYKILTFFQWPLVVCNDLECYLIRLLYRNLFLASKLSIAVEIRLLAFFFQRNVHGCVLSELFERETEGCVGAFFICWWQHV